MASKRQQRMAREKADQLEVELTINASQDEFFAALGSVAESQASRVFGSAFVGPSESIGDVTGAHCSLKGPGNALTLMKFDAMAQPRDAGTRVSFTIVEFMFEPGPLYFFPPSINAGKRFKKFRDAVLASCGSEA